MEPGTHSTPARGPWCQGITLAFALTMKTSSSGSSLAASRILVKGSIISPKARLCTYPSEDGSRSDPARRFLSLSAGAVDAGLHPQGGASQTKPPLSPRRPPPRLSGEPWTAKPFCGQIVMPTRVDRFIERGGTLSSQNRVFYVPVLRPCGGQAEVDTAVPVHQCTEPGRAQHTPAPLGTHAGP
ncbi:unnamed protein product [Lota lota]